MSNEACPIACHLKRCDAVNRPKCVHSFGETRFVSDPPRLFIPPLSKTIFAPQQVSVGCVLSQLENCLNPHSCTPASFK